jgi:hypothetical protein
MAVLNPTQFTITDPTAQAQGIIGITLLVGTATGGPYPHSYPLTAAEVSAGLASGSFTGTLASVGETLGAGTYYAVATATNAAGTSGVSPEASFQALSVPTAPTVLAFS